jgi:hypothetical protein
MEMISTLTAQVGKFDIGPEICARTVLWLRKIAKLVTTAARK